MKKISFFAILVFLISCSSNTLKKDYVKALILKAENERNAVCLRKAYSKAGNDKKLIKKIAIASGRIPDFYTYKLIAEKFGKNKEIADALAVASMFPGFNVPKKKVVKVLSNLSFSGNVAMAMLNTKDKTAFNIVLNRNKIQKNRYGKDIAFNLWRAGKLVSDKTLKDFYKTNPYETVYSLYRLKKKGIAKAEDLLNADINTKFYAMFVVDNPEKLLNENKWQLKVALIRTKNNLKTAKMFLNDSNPLVKQVAIEFYLKNGGKVSQIDLNSLNPAQIEVALPFVKNKAKIEKIFDKGGFYSYVAAPYMPENAYEKVMKSKISYYQKLKYIEKVKGKNSAMEIAKEMFKKNGETTVTAYLTEKLEEGKLKKEELLSLVQNSQKKYISFLIDAGIVKFNPQSRPLAYYIAKIKQSEKLTKFIIETDKGKLECEFFPEYAPLTCLNFYKLAKSGYYNGIFFHRVIPGFVAQAGDPTGTGYGGPEYSIRCEYNTLEYNEEGIIGMALAGKDTGGSQFFITHIATPHLNYNYTIFAKLTDGFSTLSQIPRFTRIKEVKIKN